MPDLGIEAQHINGYGRFGFSQQVNDALFIIRQFYKKLGLCASFLARFVVPAHQFSDVLRLLDEVRFSESDEVVATFRLSVADAPGHRENVAPVFRCHRHRYQ